MDEGNTYQLGTCSKRGRTGGRGARKSIVTERRWSRKPYVPLVECLSMENDRVSLENLESSELEILQNLYVNVEAPGDGHLCTG